MVDLLTSLSDLLVSWMAWRHENQETRPRSGTELYRSRTPCRSERVCGGCERLRGSLKRNWPIRPA